MRASLVGQRNNDNILVRPRQQSARPPAKRRLLLNQVRQHGARAMDQVLAKIAIVALADDSKMIWSLYRMAPHL